MLGGNGDVLVGTVPTMLEDVTSSHEELTDLLLLDDFCGKLRDAVVAAEVVDVILMAVAGQGMGDLLHDSRVAQARSEMYEPCRSCPDHEHIASTADRTHLVVRNTELRKQSKSLVPAFFSSNSGSHWSFLLRVSVVVDR